MNDDFDNAQTDKEALQKHGTARELLEKYLPDAMRMDQENRIKKAEEGVRWLLRAMGENESREGLQDTPRRVIKAWAEMTSGYGQNPAEMVTVFDSEGYDEMVAVGPVRFYSTCEHHLLPFFGEAWVAYIPEKKIIGLSKLPRLVEVFARRLQNQERLTQQIAEELDKLLAAKGTACLVKAQHFCMMARGVKQESASMTTCALRGAFFQQPQTRAEFLALTRK